MYNKLKLELQELPTNIYKAMLYTTLVDNLFYYVKEFLECEFYIFCWHNNLLYPVNGYIVSKLLLTLSGAEQLNDNNFLFIHSFIV